MTSNDLITPQKTVDRRTLIKAGAWAAPALVVAVALPAASASQTITAVGSKTAVGSSGHFRIYAQFTSTFPAATTITYSAVTSTLPAGSSWQTAPAATRSVATGTSAVVQLAVIKDLPAGSSTLTLVYTVAGGSPVSVIVTFP